ncbi:hypothetical protein [Litoribrevibacter albus]|uniref:Uncharacterized protein n=1 Tax=Litoribrevibacter albus TaxID=1473156 RepID=A0AA37W7W0_9GAMM|nr:hypothetical protein [Litoribrevibacter albus]GLQ31649.1 hypothetical protein GCM10007876_21280 [Litoribrevibacter albus]
MATVQYRPDISTGNILTIVTALILVAGNYFANEQRVATAESDVVDLRSDLRLLQTQFNELSSQNAQYNSRLDSLESSMKRVEENVNWLVRNEIQKDTRK